MSTTPERMERGQAIAWWPAAAMVGTLYLLATRGLTDLVGMAIVGMWALGFLLIVAWRAPVVLFIAFVPTMSVFIDAPIQAYDPVLITLAGLLALPAIATFRPRELRLDGVQWFQLLFLASVCTTFLGPFDTRRLIYAFKIFGMGWLSFEVARNAAARFGRRPLLLGLALFAAIVALGLVYGHQTTDVPTARMMKLRNQVTGLGWGVSNYVAAVLVMLLPVLQFFMRESLPGTPARWAASIAFVGSIAVLPLTTSRGGMLVGFGYLILSALGQRRRILWALAGVLVAASVIAFTPFGAALQKRFTDPVEMYSIGARWIVWKETWERGVAHLPFGVGHYQGLGFEDRMAGWDPHNYPLSLFSEGGPLALLLWGGLIVALWRMASRVAEAGAPAAAQALKGLILVALINSLFEPTFVGYLYYLLFWWCAGLLVAGDARGRAGRTPLLERVPAARP